MSLLVATGVFNKETSGSANATDDVDCGFDPKAFMVWGNYDVTTTTNSISKGDSSFFWGMDEVQIDDAITSCFHDEDGQTTMDSHSSSATAGGNNIIRLKDGDGTTILQAQTSAITDGVRLNYSINTTNAIQMHWMAFGGSDIVGTNAGTLVVPTVSTGVVNYTVDDDNVKNISDGEGIIFFAGRPGQTSFNSFSSMWGCAVSPSKEACIAAQSDAGVTTSDTGMLSNNSTCIGNMFGSGPSQNYAANFDGWTANGFDLDWTDISAGTNSVDYFIIKGGIWDCGMGTAKTTPAGTKVFATEFQPIVLWTVMGRRTTNGSGSEHVSFDMGAADGSHVGHSAGLTEQDAVTTSHVGRAGTNAKLCRSYDPSANPQTVTGEAELDSFNAEDFTLDFTNDAPAAYQFLWMVGASIPTKTFTMDIVVQKPSLTKTFTMDIVIEKELNKTFTMDIVIQKPSLTKTFTMDIILQKETTKTFTMDIVLQKPSLTKTFTMDIVLSTGTITKTFTMDIILQKPSLTKTFTMDIILEKQATKTFTIDIVIQKPSLTKTFTMDIVISLFAARTKTFTIDIFIIRTPSTGANAKSFRRGVKAIAWNRGVDAIMYNKEVGATRV